MLPKRSLWISLFLICIASLAFADETHKQLRWMGHWKGEGLREQLVLEVLDDFKYLNQDIDLEFKFAADILPEKTRDAEAHLIAEMVRSGNITWDVIWLDQAIYKRTAELLDDPLWGKTHLVDFSQTYFFERKHKPVIKEDINLTKQTGGIWTGPYIEGFFYAIWYNKHVAKQLGLNIKESEMRSWDMLNYAKQIDRYNQTATNPVSLFIDFNHSGAMLRLAHNLFLSASLEEQGGSPPIALLRIAEFFESLSTHHPLLYNDNVMRFKEAARLFENDQALFMIDPTWRYNTFKKSYPKLIPKMGLAQLPGFRRQNYCAGGFMPVWAVMKNSPNRTAGVRLLKFWSSPDVADKWVRYTKNPTGLNGNLYDPKYGNDIFAFYQRKLTKNRNVQPDIFETPSHPVHALSKQLKPLLRGDTTAEKVYYKLQKKP